MATAAGVNNSIIVYLNHQPMVARSDFSDDEDYALVQLVLKHQSASGQIDWIRVTRQFPGSGSGSRLLRKTTLQLRQRLKSLKRTHGSTLQSFPPRFFKPAPVRCVLRKPLTAPPMAPTTHPSPTTQPSSMMAPPTLPSISITSPPTIIQPLTVLTSTQLLRSISPPTSISQPVVIPSSPADLRNASCAHIWGFSKPTAIVQSLPKTRLVRRTKPLRDSFANASSANVTTFTSMSLHDVYSAITRIFAMITRADVRQPPGERGLNTGEILPVGVTTMIEVMRIGTSDVFGDIGSGTGSVLAQVALQTAAVRCVGVEIRCDLAAQSRECMRRFTQEFSRLSCVSILTGDIKNVTDEISKHLRGCTVLFCNNKVFEPVDNLAVQAYIASSDARLVLVMERFCGRCHGDRCINKFCQMWEIERTIQVCVSWLASPVEMFVYHRRIGQSSDTLMALIESMGDDSD